MNVPVYQPTQDLVARAIVGSGALQIRELSDPARWARWRDRPTPATYSFAELGADPGATAIICSALVGAVRAEFDGARAIVGVGHGGLYWAALTAHAAGLPYAALKLGSTEHDNPHDPLDPLPSGSSVVIVDDYVASGATFERAVKDTVRGGRLQVAGVLAITSCGQREAIEASHRVGMPVRVLVAAGTVLAEASAAGLLTQSAAEEIQQFLRSPATHRWRQERLS